jgi:hypothetical protein
VTNDEDSDSSLDFLHQRILLIKKTNKRRSACFAFIREEREESHRREWRNNGARSLPRQRNARWNENISF